MSIRTQQELATNLRIKTLWYVFVSFESVWRVKSSLWLESIIKGWKGLGLTCHPLITVDQVAKTSNHRPLPSSPSLLWFVVLKEETKRASALSHGPWGPIVVSLVISLMIQIWIIFRMWGMNAEERDAERRLFVRSEGEDNVLSYFLFFIYFSFIYLIFFYAF